MNNNEKRESRSNYSTPRLINNSHALSVENVQSLNAAYTTIPSYFNDFEQTARSKTLGRISSAHGTSSHQNKKTCDFMSSFPNLTVMSSTNATPSRDLISAKENINHSQYQATSRTGKELPMNGEDKPNRNSGGSLLEMKQQIQVLRKEVDIKESKLESNMNNIKTFWSPELKKERSLRKEESQKLVVLREELKVAQEENQHLHMTMQALQDELKVLHNLNQLLHNDFASNRRRESNSNTSTLPSDPEDVRILQENNERLDRENVLLQQTVEEMEARIEAQQQTLDTRDESVRKLMGMLRCKAMSVSDEKEVGLSVEMDALKAQLAEYENRLVRMDLIVENKETEIQKLKQMNTDVFDDSSKVRALQEILNGKDTKIASLERIVRDLENELATLRREEATFTAERREEMKNAEASRNQIHVLKAQIEQMKSQMQKRETELLTVQTRLDTMSKQQSDSRQHIDVLKESLLAKEQSSAILHSEVESLRSRLDEKQEFLEQKQEQLNRVQEENISMEEDISHLRGTMDVKDRKMTVLLKKIDSLKESLAERDDGLNSMKSRLFSLQENTTSFDATISSMETALLQKDENLRIVKDKYQAELDEARRINGSLEKMLDEAKAQIHDQNESLDNLKDKAASLASSDLKKDSKIKQLEMKLEQKLEELSLLDSQLQKANHSTVLAKTKEENKEKIEHLQQIVEDKSDETEKCQKQLDRLLVLLTEMENEKHAKDKKIVSLEKETKELQAKIKALNTQMSDELKRKGAAQSKDIANYLAQLSSSKERVEELEVALKESLNITAEREDVLVREEQRRQNLEKQMEELLVEFNKTKSILMETRKRLASAEASISQKDQLIQQIRIEKRKQLIEALDMKHQALQAAISEKDANIALLELSHPGKGPNLEEVSKLQREKDSLMRQLKQQTVNRLSLVNESKEMNQKNESQLHSSVDDGEGIWA